MPRLNKQATSFERKEKSSVYYITLHLTSHIKMAEQNKTKKASWIFVILGIFQIFMGIIALGLPMLVGATFMWLVGIALFVAMALSLYQMLVVPNYRLWNFFSGLFYGLAAVVFIWHPLAALASLTILLGWLFIVGGVIRLLMAYKTKSGWLIFNGIITLLLGIFIVSKWPEDSAFVIGTFIAIDLMISGWTLATMGAYIRRFGK